MSVPLCFACGSTPGPAAPHARRTSCATSIEGNINACINELYQNRWEDRSTLLILSRAFKVTVVVIYDDNQPLYIVKQPHPQGILYLGCEVSSHYQSLVHGPTIMPEIKLEQLIEESELDDFDSMKLGAPSGTQPVPSRHDILYTRLPLKKASVRSPQSPDFLDFKGGTSDFATLVKDKGFIDKTGFISVLLNLRWEVQLITRPFRFGKTTLMSMLYYFFSNHEPQAADLFKGLKITREAPSLCRTYQNQYPVIYFSFGAFSGSNFNQGVTTIWQIMRKSFRDFREELMKSKQLTEKEKTWCRQVLDELGSDDPSMRSKKNQAFLQENFKLFQETLSTGLDPTQKQQKWRGQIAKGEFNESIGALAVISQIFMSLVNKHYNKKVIILIGEYDRPIHTSHQKNYYPAMCDFIQALFTALLKDNKYLEFGVITGVLPIAQEEIFSGLNNVMVDTLIDGQHYSPYFGFMANEINTVIQQRNLNKSREEQINYLSNFEDWYGGYELGGKRIYNPWPIIHFLKKNKHEMVWSESSELIRGTFSTLQRKSPGIYQECKQALTNLRQGKSYRLKIKMAMVFPQLHETQEAIMSLLVAGGYLTVKHYDALTHEALLAIPNLEIFQYFTNLMNELEPKRVFFDNDWANFIHKEEPRALNYAALLYSSDELCHSGLQRLEAKDWFPLTAFDAVRACLLHASDHIAQQAAAVLRKHSRTDNRPLINRLIELLRDKELKIRNLMLELLTPFAYANDIGLLEALQSLDTYEILLKLLEADTLATKVNGWSYLQAINKQYTMDVFYRLVYSLEQVETTEDIQWLFRHLTQFEQSSAKLKTDLQRAIKEWLTTEKAELRVLALDYFIAHTDSKTAITYLFECLNETQQSPVIRRDCLNLLVKHKQLWGIEELAHLLQLLRLEATETMQESIIQAFLQGLFILPSELGWSAIILLKNFLSHAEVSVQLKVGVCKELGKRAENLPVKEATQLLQQYLENGNLDVLMQAIDLLAQALSFEENQDETDYKISDLETGLEREEQAISLNSLWGFLVTDKSTINKYCAMRVKNSIKAKSVIHQALFFCIFYEEKKIVNEEEISVIAELLKANEHSNLDEICVRKTDILCYFLKSKNAVIQLIALRHIMQYFYFSQIDVAKIKGYIQTIKRAGNQNIIEMVQQCLRKIEQVEKNRVNINNQLQSRREVYINNILLIYQKLHDFLIEHYQQLLSSDKLGYDISQIAFNLRRLDGAPEEASPLDLASFNHLFIQGELAKKVVLGGNAGMGKTTYTKMLISRWANSQVENRESSPFQWVFLLNFRNINVVNEELTLENLIKTQCFNNQDIIENINTKEAIHAILRQAGNRVLVILDGYNELNTFSENHHESLRKFEESFLQQTHCHILLTTRPHYLNNYRFDAMCQLEALSLELIKKAIKVYLTPDEAMKLIGLYERNNALQQFMHIPMYLWLFCSAVKEGNVAMGKGISLADVFKIFFSTLVNEEKFQLALESLSFLCTQLQTLSFNSLQIKAVIKQERFRGLTAKQLEEMLSSPNLSILIEKKPGEENEYQFIHHSLQENLTAKYVARFFLGPDSLLRQFTQTNKLNPYYQNIVALMASYLPKEQLNSYFDYILEDSRYYGLYECILFIKIVHYLNLTNFEEADDKYQQKIIQTVSSWIAKTIDEPSRYQYAESLLWETLTEFPTVLLNSSIQAIFETAMDDKKESVINTINKKNLHLLSESYQNLLIRAKEEDVQQSDQENIIILSPSSPNVLSDSSTDKEVGVSEASSESDPTMQNNSNNILVDAGAFLGEVDKSPPLFQEVCKNPLNEIIKKITIKIEKNERDDNYTILLEGLYNQLVNNKKNEVKKNSRKMENLTDLFIVEYKKYFQPDFISSNWMQDNIITNRFVSIFNVVLLDEYYQPQPKSLKQVEALKMFTEDFLDKSVLSKKTPAKALVEPLTWFLDTFYHELSKGPIDNLEKLYESSEVAYQNQLLETLINYPNSAKFSLLAAIIEKKMKFYLSNFEWKRSENTVHLQEKANSPHLDLHEQKINLLYGGFLLGKWSYFNKDIMNILIYIATTEDNTPSFLTDYRALAETMVSHIDLSFYIGALEEPLIQQLDLAFHPLLDSTSPIRLFEAMFQHENQYDTYYLFISEKLKTSLSPIQIRARKEISWFNEGVEYIVKLPDENHFAKRLNFSLSQHCKMTDTMRKIEQNKANNSMNKKTVEALRKYRKWAYSQPIEAENLMDKLLEKVERDVQKEKNYMQKKLEGIKNIDVLYTLKENYKKTLFSDLIDTEINKREENKLKIG
ncbi:MAG: AAA family ATPase [Gammaproteobacteria bacterium]|nr:AAA family ATPase [Gammaproteobacteria bacterium]